MQERWDAGKVGCWTGGMLDLEMLDLGMLHLGMPGRRCRGKEGCRKGGVQERRDTGKVGFKR